MYHFTIVPRVKN